MNKYNKDKNNKLITLIIKFKKYNDQDSYNYYFIQWDFNLFRNPTESKRIYIYWLGRIKFTLKFSERK